MLKTSPNKLSTTLNNMSGFDKLTLFINIIFFIGGVILPIASIVSIASAETTSIRLLGLEYRKTSILIILITTSSIGISINSKFKARLLQYLGVNNDIVIRFLQKFFLIFLLLFFGEMIIHLRTTLTQTINLSRGYYLLTTITIIGLIIDFLFLQRQYKLQRHHQHLQTTISREESSFPEKTGFKNLFDE